MCFDDAKDFGPAGTAVGTGFQRRAYGINAEAGSICHNIGYLIETNGETRADHGAFIDFSGTRATSEKQRNL